MKKFLLGFIAAVLSVNLAVAQTANGRATTAAPSYSNATAAPLSLDLAGSLRTNCITGCSGGSFNNNADAVATSATNGQTAAWLYGWNGATFDRLQVDANKNLKVGISQGGNAATVSAGGALKVDASATTQPISGTVAATQSGTWTVQPGNTANTTPWLFTMSQGGNAAIVSAAGAQKVDGSAVTQPVSGTVAATQSGTWTVQPGNTANTTPWLATISQGGNAASVSASNALKVDGSAVTQPVSGTFGVGSTGSAVPASAGYQGNNVGGNLTGQIGCGSSVVYDASTSGSTQLVAISGSTAVYVCGYSIIAGGAVNVKLITGTGSACATGSANITPAYQLTAQAGLVDGSPVYRGLKGAASSALCINTSAGIAVQAIVYYTQF